MNKIVTLCGSMKYLKEQMLIAEKLELEHEWCVLQCGYGDIAKSYKQYNEKEKAIFGKLHFQKIDISDAIYVVNIGGYIGEATQKEIEYAKEQGKEIIYHEK